MLHFISFMVLILANPVASQAAGITGSVRLESQSWVTGFTGETEVDGLPVIVNFDEDQRGLEIPEAMIGFGGLVPFKKADKRNFRLNFIVSHNPRIQSAYEVQPRSLLIDGTPRFAYVSSLDQNKLFFFVATKQADGNMLVTFTRKTTGDASITGQIILSPTTRTLN